MIALALALAAATPAATSAAPASTNAPFIDPARMAAARELMKTVHTEEMLDKVFGQISSTYGAQVVNSLEAKPEFAGTVRQLIASLPGGEERLQTILNEEFAASLRKQYPDLLDDIAREYASRFTDDELHQIIAFYSSGVGAKALAAVPEIQQTMFLKGRTLGQLAGGEAAKAGLERAQKEAASQPKGSKNDH